MTDAEIERKAAEDAFARTSLGIPLDHQLRAMSYISLCDLLSNYQPGTAQHSIIEREKVRRDLIENATLTKTKTSIWNHPVMKWVLGLVAAIVVALASKFILALF